ncbi:MAG TPA: dolichyl-phosphate beta-glucosyltransferase [Gaiellaceae bacterium]|nr:dolichyl-phosphate beta-glucosyltransferase [Gaiellaceae bacterium]
MTPRSLCIVVPVYNEERRLPVLLRSLHQDADDVAGRAGLVLAEVIVVDDGSTDGTADLLAAADDLGGRFSFERFPENRGKGAAVRAGMLRATSDVALMTDVDLSTPLEELVGLAAEVERGVDVCIASRALRGSEIVVRQPLHRELMGKAFNVIVRTLTRIPWKDTQCGFKLFRLSSSRRLFELQRVDGFAFDMELLVLARRLDLRVAEVPVRWIDNPDTRVGLVTSSAMMAFDALRIAVGARRPLSVVDTLSPDVNREREPPRT